MAMNAALAFIEGAKPRNEMEAALIMQMLAGFCAVRSATSARARFALRPI
jgi:hypothetical protein